MPRMTFPTLSVLLMLVKKRKIANYRQCVPPMRRSIKLASLWLFEHINDILSRSALTQKKGEGREDEEKKRTEIRDRRSVEHVGSTN